MKTKIKLALEEYKALATILHITMLGCEDMANLEDYVDYATCEKMLLKIRQNLMAMPRKCYTVSLNESQSLMFFDRIPDMMFGGYESIILRQIKEAIFREFSSLSHRRKIFIAQTKEQKLLQ